jgi:hypothetical protein
LDHIRNIRLIALKNVLDKPDDDARWRSIARWYSKTFATPLHEVDYLPQLDVLQAYFEDFYEGAEQERLHTELEDLLQDQDPLNKALDKSSNESDMDKLEKELVEHNKRLKEGAVAPLVKAAQNLGDTLKGLRDVLSDKSLKEEEFSLDFKDLKED